MAGWGPPGEQGGVPVTLRGGAVPAGQAGAGAGPGAVRAGDDPVCAGARPGPPGAAHPRPAPAPPPALRRLSRPRGTPTPLSPPLGLSASPPAWPHSRVGAGAASPGEIRAPRAALGHYRPTPGPPRGRGCGTPVLPTSNKTSMDVLPAPGAGHRGGDTGGDLRGHEGLWVGHGEHKRGPGGHGRDPRGALGVPGRD